MTISDQSKMHWKVTFVIYYIIILFFTGFYLFLFERFCHEMSVTGFVWDCTIVRSTLQWHSLQIKIHMHFEENGPHTYERSNLRFYNVLNVCFSEWSKVWLREFMIFSGVQFFIRRPLFFVYPRQGVNKES